MNWPFPHARPCLKHGPWPRSETSLHRRLDAQLFFWRDKIGTEVDLLIDQPQGAQTVEFKAGQTVAGDWFNALRKYQALRTPSPKSFVLFKRFF